MATRRWISVPFEEKDDVKKIGGRWDPKARLWYVPDGFSMAPFARWATFDWTNTPATLIFLPSSSSGLEHKAKVYNVPVINGRCKDYWELLLGGNEKVATCDMTRYCSGLMSENIFHGNDVGLARLIEHIRGAIVSGQDLLRHKASWSPAMQHAARIPWIFKAHNEATADQVFAPVGIA